MLSARAAPLCDEAAGPPPVPAGPSGSLLVLFSVPVLYVLTVDQVLIKLAMDYLK